MSEPKSLDALIAGQATAHMRERAERAERLARAAEVELVRLKAWVSDLESHLGETRSLLREAREQTSEVIAERDRLRAQAEARARLMVVTP